MYTKGPWKVDLFNYAKLAISEFGSKNPNDSGRLVAYAYDKFYDKFLCEGISPEEKVANAHLIAAAPDLYEMGRELYKRIANGRHDDVFNDAILDYIDTTLKKAEGKE